MKKKILLMTVLLILVLLFFIPNENKKNIVLAQGVSLDCIMVTGGCGVDGQTTWSSRADTRGSTLCDSGQDLAAVHCPIISGVRYHVLSGGCRQSGASHAKLGEACPTNAAFGAPQPQSCEDWGTPGPYEYFFCDWDEGTNWEIAYALCCNI